MPECSQNGNVGIYQHALFIRPKIYLKRFNSPHTTILTVTCYFNEMFR